MFSCIKTQEGLLHSHAQQNWQTASKTPEKKASVSLNQHEILGSRSVSAKFLVQFSMLFFLVCCLFAQGLQQRINVVAICVQLHILLNACMDASIRVANSNNV